MNYDQPRQILSGPQAGKWQYTTGNRRTGTHAIGYCWAPGPHSDVADLDTWVSHYHDTEDQARECYAAYKRSKVTLHPDGLGSWSDCSYPGCLAPAHHYATAGEWNLAALCDDHLNTPDAIVALGLDRPAGDSIHS